MKNSIQATIKGFQDRNTVIELANGELLNWPIKDLPESVSIGDTVEIRLVTAQDKEESNIKAMKQILQELIN